MKYLYLVLSVISEVTMVSTLVCGYWIRSNNVTDAGSISFHAALGTAAAISGIVVSILLFFLALRWEQ